MEYFRQTWSRRKFMASLAGAGAAWMLNPLRSWAVADIDPHVAAIVATTIGIDTHNHIDVPLDTVELPGPETDLSGELKKSGLSAIVMTFATDYKRNIQPGEAYERFLNGLKAMDTLLADNGMKRAFNVADIEAAHRKHQPTVVQSVEGCHFLEGKAERLTEAYNRGLRHLGLLHDSDAAVPLGDVYTNPARWDGLTAFGADVIRECNRLGILVDLAHASNDTINAALQITTKPVLISHTGLDTRLGQNARMAEMMRPRLISSKQAKTVADAGGVIGVWTHLADTPLEYARNIRAMVDVAGIDHVGIGTDTKLTPSYRAISDNPGPGKAGIYPGRDTAATRRNGPPQDNNGPDGRQHAKRVGERTNEAWENETAGFYYTVVDALLQTGFTEDEIARIGGGNYCRLLDAATAGK